MNETDNITVGSPMPRIRAVSPVGTTSISVEWAEGRSDIETVDLAPLIMTLKIYKPLRDDPALFQSVRVSDDGAAIAWGDASIDMAATSVERLAEEVMTAEDFSAFLKRQGWTFDAAAGQLGISRRLVAYYASGRPIPRYIALACAYLEDAPATRKEESENAGRQVDEIAREVSEARAELMMQRISEDTASRLQRRIAAAKKALLAADLRSADDLGDPGVRDLVARSGHTRGDPAKR